MQLSAALIVCLCAMAYAQDRVYNKQHKATINEDRKTIDAQFGGYKDSRADSAQMAVVRDSVNLMLKNHQQRMRAQVNGNTAVAGKDAENVQAKHDGAGNVQAVGDGKQVEAGKISDAAVQAKNHDGQRVAASQMDDRAMATQGRNRANAMLTKEGEVVRGGSAQQGANGGTMNNEMINGRKVSKLEANRRYQADAAAISRDQWNVQTGDKQDLETRGQYAAKSDGLTEQEGTGIVNAKNKKGAAQYKYDIEQGNDGTAQADLNQVGAGSGVFSRRTTGWKCQAVKDGESTCLDSNGKIVGKVMTNSQGDATVVDNNGVVVGRGKVNKINEEQYEVVVSDGLALAKTEQLKEYDCFSEIIPGGSQEHTIKIENVKASVDGIPIDAEGAKTLSWPTCFDVTADVTIPADIDPSRLAFEYVGHVMPLGSMKCMDRGTCGASCYYCNACQKEEMLGDSASLFTGDSNAVCDIHGGIGKQQVSMTVCPPEEVEKAAFCGGFSRQLVGNDYYNYNGSINAQVRVWLRPDDADLTKLHSDFFTKIAVPLIKTGLVNAYKVDNLKNGAGLADPTNNELLQWYVRENGDEKLMACRRGVIDYNVGGSDVKSNILIDAFANAPNAQNVQLLSDAPCKEWAAYQQLEYDTYHKEHQESAATSSNSLSDLLGRFSRGRRL